jgi:bifunctional ADP-heptose synthase (sugar kinase/adenylyltransferase)
MRLFSGGRLNAKTEAREVFDVSGAGDTPIAALVTGPRSPLVSVAWMRCTWPMRPRGS